MKKSLSWIAIVFSCCFLASCSYIDKLKFWGDGEDLTQPATPLKEIDESVELQQRWNEKAGDGNDELYVRLLPAIAGERIFVVDASGDLFALNKKTGQRVWEHEIDQRITGGVGILADELLLVGSEDGEVLAYQQKDGSEAWRAQLSSEILAAPLGSSTESADHIIAFAGDNTVYGLEVTEGETDWEVKNPMPALVLRGSSMPLILGEDVVYAGLSNGRVLALASDTGRRLWEHVVSLPRGRSELQRMVDISGKMALVDDTLYVVTYQGRVAALTVATGRERWQRNMSSYSGVSANADYVTLSDTDDVVWLLSAPDGSTLWKQEDLMYRVLTAPVFWEDYIVVGDKEGYIHVFSPADGTIIGRVQVDKSGITVPPMVENGVLYVLANNGRLAAYSIAD
ncbi:MAG: outer membrane protein assembly factor BamB [Gammaproteobacteria bacterium]